MNLWNRSPLAPKKSNWELLEEWIVAFVYAHPLLIFSLLMVLAWAIIILLCYTLIPPLESGVWYNHQLGGGGL